MIYTDGWMDGWIELELKLGCVDSTWLCFGLGVGGEKNLRNKILDTTAFGALFSFFTDQVLVRITLKSSP